MATWATITFDENGGSGGGYTTLYANCTKFSSSDATYNINYWATAKSTSTSYRVTSMGVPTLSGKRFAGYFLDGKALCNYKGVLFDDTIEYFLTSLNVSSSATWVDDFAAIEINRGSGSGGAARIFRSRSSAACYGDVLQTTVLSKVELPKRKNYRCIGITMNGVQIVDEHGEFTAAFAEMSVDADATATCTWEFDTFGTVEDYFSLGSSALVPVSSSSGDTRRHVTAYNGAGELATVETSGVWRNPTVTYEVVADTTLKVVLGTGFAGGASLSRSGYMITSVEVVTSVGEPPQVKVVGTANEGYTKSGTGYNAKATNAVKTYEVSVKILAAHHAQNLMSSLVMTNHGELQDCTLIATADAVVCVEGGMPCASDICHGRMEVSATAITTSDQTAPTAGTDFVMTSEAESYSHVGYKTWNVSARKELK